jgi:hypothetical protein
MQRSAVRRELLVFLFFLAVTVALTWPEARHLDTSLSDQGDPLLVTFLIDWDCWALTHAPLHLFDAPMYAPALMPLAYSENFLGPSLFALPFFLAGLSPIAVYNLCMLLGFALAAYGGYALARVVTGSLPASLLAGLFSAFLSYKFDHLAHLQIIWSGFLSLLLAALLAYWRWPSWRNAALITIAFVLNGLTNIHYFLFGGLALVATLLFFALAAPRRGRRFWLQLGGALAVGGLLMLPVLLPYKIVSKTYGMKRIPEEVLDGSATWQDWLMATPRNVVWGRMVTDDDASAHERRLFPGVFALLFALAAVRSTKRRDDDAIDGAANQNAKNVVVDAVAIDPVAIDDAPALPIRRRWLFAVDVLIVLFAIGTYVGIAARRIHLGLFDTTLIGYHGADVPAMLLVAAIVARMAMSGWLRRRVARSRFPLAAWIAAIWIAIGFAGSFGMRFFFHAFLFRHVLIYQSIRVPARWAVVAYVGLSVWIALGAVALLAHRRLWQRRAITGVLFALLLVDILPRIRYDYGAPPPAPVHRWLASQRSSIRGSILELPMSNFNVPYLYLLGTTTHHLPEMNGSSGFEPPIHRTLREAGERREFDDAYLGTIERSGGALLIVHSDWLVLQSEALRAWLQKEVAAGRLAFVRRFDDNVFGDYVFAVTKNQRDWRRLRGTDVPDPAGNMPDDNLQRFYRDAATYNDATFGRMDQPQYDTEHDRRLTVSGWALSPYGIRSATVLIHGGKVRVPAALSARDDISRTWPWYQQTPYPAFTAIIPKRPKGVPRETEVQMELVNGRGDVTRLRDVAIVWK